MIIYKAVKKNRETQDNTKWAIEYLNNSLTKGATYAGASSAATTPTATAAADAVFVVVYEELLNNAVGRVTRPIVGRD